MIVSCFAESVAVIEPDPATVDIIVASMGTGDSRALNVSPADVFCAEAVRNSGRADIKDKIAAHKNTAMILRRSAIIFSKARIPFLEMSIAICADHTRAVSALQAHISVHLKNYVTRRLPAASSRYINRGIGVRSRPRRNPKRKSVEED